MSRVFASQIATARRSGAALQVKACNVGRAEAAQRMHSVLPMTVGRHAFAVDDGYYRFSGTHHVRYIDPDVPLHVISRVFQGRHLLRPCGALNGLIVGVVGRALLRYSRVRLYAMAFMSNHVHFMLQGPPTQVPAFIGFVKREISRRWGRRPEVGWRGTMWHEYLAAALPTSRSQVGCLKYILSQGVKEGLVARPQDWPGVHCARALATGSALEGTWLDATAYSRAIDAQSRTRNPKHVSKSDYESQHEVRFDPIPAWRALDEQSQQSEVHRLIDEVIAEGAALRVGRGVVGVRRVCRTPLDRRTELPRPPWFERERRRLICWESANAPAARQYIQAYWEFQRSFREAALKDARRCARVFPPGAYAPGGWMPLPVDGSPD